MSLSFRQRRGLSSCRLPSIDMGKPARPQVARLDGKRAALLFVPPPSRGVQLMLWVRKVISR